MISLFQRLAEDGSSLVRSNCTNLTSQWAAGVQVAASALQQVIPDSWRAYTVDMPDSDIILEHIVDNSELDGLLELITTLSKVKKIHTEALQRISPLRGPVYAVTEKFAKDVDDTVLEGKLMLAVRACETVTLRKLPACKTAKSKSATAREAKRLIGKLDGPEVPNVLMRRLDEAAETKK